MGELLINHSSSSPVLPPSHFYRIIHLKNLQRFENEDEFKNFVTSLFKSLSAEFLEERMKKLVKPYHKYFEVEGSYVEK